MKKSRTVRPTEQLDERQPTRGRRFNTGALRAPSRPHGVAGRDGGQVPSSSGGGRYRSAAPGSRSGRRLPRWVRVTRRAGIPAHRVDVKGRRRDRPLGDVMEPAADRPPPPD